jgi:hypothetical protein
MNDRGIKPSQVVLLIWTGLLVVMYLGATYLSSCVAQEVDYLPAPGLSEPIPMPPEYMRLDIERDISRGTAQVAVFKGGPEMNRLCRKDTYLLGCATQTWCKLGIVYVREGLNPILERMAHVHEVAHCRGWKHP